MRLGFADLDALLSELEEQADLALDLTPQEAQAVYDWIVGKRWGPYPQDRIQGRALDHFLKQFRAAYIEGDDND